MAMRGSIIIRCYNEARNIGRLLWGISQQSMRDFEVIAVDSGSTDDTPGILERHGVRRLSLEPDEFSFGRSCNLGADAARGEFLVFVSAHAYPVYRNWLEELLKPFAAPDTALTYGRQRGNERTAYSERQIFAAWYPDRDNGHQDHPFCNNANSAVRRSVWEQVRFDETLTGLEDIDFARRAMLLGHKVAYSASAEIVHIHEERPSMVFNRFRREAIAYRAIFPHEQISLADFLKLYLGNVASDCYHAWQEGRLCRHYKEILQFRLMQFWGAYQGMSIRGPVSPALRRRFYYPNGLRRGNAGATGRNGCTDTEQTGAIKSHVVNYSGLSHEEKQT
jgi:rhamnosyltransferase